MSPRGELVVAALALACAACDPFFSLQVRVADPADVPVERAMVVLTNCPRQNVEASGEVAALTDAQGLAAISGLGSQYPDCEITVMRPGYQAWQGSFRELCDGDLAACDRVQTLPIVLAPASAAPPAQP